MYSTLIKAFHDSRKTIMWVCIGFISYIAMIMLFYPTMVEQEEELQDLIDAYPESMLAMFSGGETDQINFADPGVYFNTQAMTWVLLVLGGILIAQVLKGIIDAERKGTMDLILSLPISRREMLAGRMLNAAITTLIGLTAVFVTTYAFTFIFEEFDVGLMEIAAGVYGSFFLLMAMTGITFALASVVPSSKTWTGAIAMTYFFLSYVLLGFAASVEGLDVIKPLLIFDYFNAGVAMSDGLDISKTLFLIVVTVATSGFALWQFDKKELGV